VSGSTDPVARLAQLRQRTLWDALTQTAQLDPGHEAIVAWDDDRHETRISYGALVERSERLSGALAAAGVRRGDRVALLMTNRVEFVVTYFASVRIGAILVPINTRFAPAEIAFVLRDSGARHLVMIDRFRSADFLGALDGLIEGWRDAPPGGIQGDALPDLRTVLVLNRDGTVPAASTAVDLRRAIDREPGVSAMAAAAEMAAAVRAQDVAVIKYTSGSTGFPKGAMLEHGGLVADALLHTERLEIGADDRWFGNPPLFHVGGSVWGLLSCVVRGATLVFGETFDPDVTLDLVAQERCTVLFGVPTVSRDILSRARQRPSDLGSVRLMGGGLDVALAAAMRAAIPQLTTTINGYGLTEGYGTSAAPGPRQTPQQQATTCGQLYPGIEHRVVDVDGRDVEPGATGELLLRGLVMRGYWNNPQATAMTLDPDGWLHTGDLVSVDADRFLTYRGRLKSMLKIGGENVAAEEVERVLLAHPEVQDGAVVGVPDERRDEVAWAYVQPEPGARPTPAELRRWSAEHLANFKVPERIVLVDELPRIGSGKVDRTTIERWAREAAQPARAAHGQSRQEQA
jgi:fatty-acyl-CoA synthase